MLHPFITGIETTSPTPAYRGLAYIVLKELDLSDFGNRIPNLTFEIVREVTFLDAIVKEVSVGAGLNSALGSAEIDATDLAGLPIDGFVVSSERTYRERIEQFMSVYNFGACEANGKVIFQRKDRFNRFPISVDYLGAKEGEKGEDSRYQIERKHDMELPKSITINYLSLDKDYQAGALTAIRANSNSENTATMDVNFCLSDARAKELSEQKLYEAWIRRSTMTASLGPFWAFLSPGDKLDIDLAGRRRLIQLTYTLSGLLRGRLGTEDQISVHSIGDRFVLLEAGLVEYMATPMSEWYSSRAYRVGPATKPVKDVTYTDVCFSSSGRMYQPWSVCNVSGSRDISGDLTITWTRRDRSGGA